MQCDATYRKLDKLGLKYNKIDVTEDYEALHYARSLGNYSGAPIVEAGDQHWSGYKPDMLEGLVSRV